MVKAEIDDDDVSLLIRATFTYMGRMVHEGREDEYEKAQRLVMQMRQTMLLIPMSFGEMRAHAVLMYRQK